LIILGDANFSATRPGMRSSRHGKLAATIIRRAKRNKSGNKCYRIDEFKSSQHCPRCLERLQHLKSCLAEAARKGTDQHGLVEDYRVQFCRRCQIHLHRDCASAQCFTVTADALLKTGKRPAPFTRPE